MLKFSATKVPCVTIKLCGGRTLVETIMRRADSGCVTLQSMDAWKYAI